MKWKLNNKVISEKQALKLVEENYGFVYKITNLENDRFYIGKKIFKNTTKSKISKREIKETKTRKRIRRTIKESNWRTYLSSSKELLADLEKFSENQFSFEIIELCPDKTTLTYKEVWYQFHFNVLELNTYNGNILSRFFKKKPNEEKFKL